MSTVGTTTNSSWAFVLDFATSTLSSSTASSITCLDSSSTSTHTLSTSSFQTYNDSQYIGHRRSVKSFSTQLSCPKIDKSVPLTPSSIIHTITGKKSLRFYQTLIRTKLNNFRAKTASRIKSNRMSRVDQCTVACYIVLVGRPKVQTSPILEDIRPEVQTSPILEDILPEVRPLLDYINHIFTTARPPMNVMVHTMVLLTRKLRRLPQSGQSHELAAILFTSAFIVAARISQEEKRIQYSNDDWFNLTGYKMADIETCCDARRWDTGAVSLWEKRALPLSLLLETVVQHDHRSTWLNICKPVTKRTTSTVLVKGKNGSYTCMQKEVDQPVWSKASDTVYEFLGLTL